MSTAELDIDIRGPRLVPDDPYAKVAGSVDNYHVTITASTSETEITNATPQNLHICPYLLLCVNTSAAATDVTIREQTSGTIKTVLAVPAGETRGFVLDPRSPLRSYADYNTQWTATSSASVSSLEITTAWVYWP